MLVLTARERRVLALALAAAIALRAVTLGLYPLMDPTEARYAEIARKMVETGQWLVPQFGYGVPFWGKPPLSTWLSAIAMTLAGVGEFGARLPSFLLFAASCVPVRVLARRAGGRDRALWALALFASTALVFIAAGAVMTDPALALGTTLSMAGFWIAVRGPDRHRATASAAFFGGLAIGLLAKGPVAAVLTFLPIGVWVLAARGVRDAWTRLPWVGGLLLTAAAVIPWYWAAERASPGLLDYFLVGEHWKRFVEPGWKGDLYGAAHARPRGTIWLFWFAAALPWSVPALGWLTRAALRRRAELRALVADPWRLYLLLWALAPMAFFTVSGNVLATYVLPGLPAFALLVAELWQPDAADGRHLRPAVRTVAVACLALPLLLVAGIASQRDRAETALSHKALVRAWEAQRGTAGSRLLYAGVPPPSADFYSRGKAVHVPVVEALVPLLDEPHDDFVGIRASELPRLPEAVRARLESIGEFGDYRLLREAPP